MNETLNPALEFLKEGREVGHHPDAEVGEAVGVLVAVGKQEAIDPHGLGGFKIMCGVANEKHFVGVVC